MRKNCVIIVSLSLIVYCKKLKDLKHLNDQLVCENLFNTA